MSLLYLLDTNILVHLVRRDRVGVRILHFSSPLLTEPRPLVSVVTDGELRSLIFQFGWGQQDADQAHFLLNYFQRVDIALDDILKV